ncbi:putative integral membrane protein [Streptohalobacillus salinus]|uniref:Putative integral membrane protein n=1 Tax=Streptohalobacillus salinus TaxID=621096 RepID=A0A2V3W793_9BACI|nr:lipopolysaccharide assembly protein LapA domain-containing protein [Streptohalobacillus salinus]PXW90002.1 putative integral membrane protein [Streptohalobacillus salinus]
MKGQTYIILALLFALIVATFAVINVEAVEVNYLFFQSESPLILVILVSTLLGGLITGGFGIYHLIGVKKKMRQLQEENQQLRAQTAVSYDASDSKDTEEADVEVIE